MKSVRSSSFLSWGLIIVIAALAFRLVFFGISLAVLAASADEANGVLTAKNIARGEFPLLITGSPYQFPIESYLLTPLVPFLPRTAFGARYIAVLTGLISLFGFLLIGRAQPFCRRNWPCFLLLLFPSAYWLLWQAAYIPTNYNPGLMLCVFGLLSALLGRIKKQEETRLFFLAGILLGLAFCGIMLILPVLLMAGFFIFLAESWKKGVKGVVVFILGLAVGLLPYYLAGWLIPGANQAVSGSYPWIEALRRSWSLIRHNLPVAMGITPCLYPDFTTTLTLIPALALPFTVIYLLILGIVTATRGAHYFKELSKRKLLSLDDIDVFLGISWLCLLFFILSRRSHTHTYRYLLPLVWSFPFLVGYLYAGSSRWSRKALGVGIGCLILFNLTTGFELMRIWSRPGFASTQADMPDLKPALACLDSLGINHAYATMWVASRIAYETDEKILCTQPYNTRFYGWPILYKEEVDASPKVAYVLTHSDRFTADRFENDLNAMDVTCRHQVCGEFTLYTDFKSPRKPPGILVPKDQFSIKTSHNDASAGILKDGRRGQRWGSHHPQEKGMWLEITMAAPKLLEGLVLYYNQYAHDMAPSLKVSARRDNKWIVLLPSVAGRLDPFTFLNGHPVYGDKKQTILFPAIQADALHIEIVDPNPRQDWSLVEIDLYQKSGK